MAGEGAIAARIPDPIEFDVIENLDVFFAEEESLVWLDSEYSL